MTTPPWFALPTSPPQPLNAKQTNTPVIVVGAGLAGCHLAFALAKQDVPVLLLDAAEHIAAGASANEAGIVKPFVTRDANLADQFYDTAFNYLLSLLNTNEHLNEHAAFKACGVLQLLNNPYPDNKSYVSCNADQASAQAGIALRSAALHFSQAGWLNPAQLCHGLVQHDNINIRLNTLVCSIEPSDCGWRVHTQSCNQGNSDVQTLECAQLVLANGECLNQFSQTIDLPMTPASGQTSCFRVLGENPLRKVITGKRYVIPDGDNVIVGASFTRNATSREIRPEEHEKNRQALKELLPTIRVSDEVAGFSGVRSTTPDRLPVLGPMPDLSRYRQDYALLKNGLPQHRFPAASYHRGLSVIGGFGSRGIVSAPLCARLLANYLTHHGAEPQNKASQLAYWSSLLHPGRFMVRTLRRS